MTKINNIVSHPFFYGKSIIKSMLKLLVCFYFFKTLLGIYINQTTILENNQDYQILLYT